MRKITIIYDGTIYTYKWIKTLFWVKKQLKKEGVVIEYINWRSLFPIGDVAQHQIDTLLSYLDRNELDIVAIAFHYSTSNFNNKRGLSKLELLRLLKEKSRRLVWLDTADSTGNCQFEVMPYVDVYLKKQLLKDINIYSTKLYGTKLFTDYYHKLLGIEDREIDVEYTLLDSKYKDKLKLSWNIGISDFWSKSRYCLLRPSSIFVPRMFKVDSHRETNMFFNGTLNYSPLSGYQRRTTIEKMLANNKTLEPNPTMKMPPAQYVWFMKDAKTAISPFGWGEICYRDFEAFVYGATLVKPDMNQVATFPDFFISDETYVPLKWDYSNFDEVIDGIGTQHYRDIAKRGQDIYSTFLNTKEGKKEFVKHILSVLL